MRKFIYIKELSILFCLNDLIGVRLGYSEEGELYLILFMTGGVIDEVGLDIGKEKADVLLAMIARALEGLYIGSIIE